MRQVTLVALYGHKPEHFQELVRGCVEIIQASPLRRIFRPYHINQIHGTLIGMEKLVGYADHFNANSLSTAAPMSFGPLKPTLQKHLPMTIQIGGFEPAFTRFHSFGRLPYERSFQVQWATKRFTIIGWPHKDGDFSFRQLESLRDKICQECRIKHKYSADNDLFMVLGEIAGSELLSDAELAQLRLATQSVEVEVRDFLAAKKNSIELDLDQVCVVQYQVETLPLSSTMAYRLHEARVGAELINSLYD